jgi:hypothetical protein
MTFLLPSAGIETQSSQIGYPFTRWAHFDCTSTETCPTKDPILNDLIAKQHQNGFYIDDSKSSKADYQDVFNMKEIKAGTILYVYEEATKSKKVDTLKEVVEEDSEEDSD